MISQLLGVLQYSPRRRAKAKSSRFCRRFHSALSAHFGYPATLVRTNQANTAGASCLRRVDSRIESHRRTEGGGAIAATEEIYVCSLPWIREQRSGQTIQQAGEPKSTPEFAERLPNAVESVCRPGSTGIKIKCRSTTSLKIGILPIEILASLRCPTTVPQAPASFNLSACAKKAYLRPIKFHCTKLFPAKLGMT